MSNSDRNTGREGEPSMPSPAQQLNQFEGECPVSMTSGRSEVNEDSRRPVNIGPPGSKLGMLALLGNGKYFSNANAGSYAEQFMATFESNPKEATAGEVELYNRLATHFSTQTDTQVS